jgi:hypothetical protein
VPGLADAVLPLIRTRGELWRRSAANEHGVRMHEAVDILEAAATTGDPAEVYTVTHKALASAITVIARADDSGGIVGDACRRLLDLHPRAAATAVPAGRLIDWMMKFQFDGQVDYFDLDPVAYAPALGEKGMAAYRSRLDGVRADLGPEPAGEDRWSSPHRHEWFVLDWNAKRLAVLDRDVDAIIRTHARDRKVAGVVRRHRTQVSVPPCRQLLVRTAGWPPAEPAARRPVGPVPSLAVLGYRRRPAQGGRAVVARIPRRGAHRSRPQPRDAVLFALTSLEDVPLAWDLAGSLGLEDNRTWNDLAEAYEKIDAYRRNMGYVIPVLGGCRLDSITALDLDQLHSQQLVSGRRQKRGPLSKRAAFEADGLLRPISAAPGPLGRGQEGDTSAQCGRPGFRSLSEVDTTTRGFRVDSGRTPIIPIRHCGRTSGTAV